MTENKRKVITGKVRFSYANVHEPRALAEGEEATYSVALLIDKEDEKTIAKIEKAVDAAIKEGADKLKKTPKNKIKLPLRDGDEDKPDDENYQGKLFVNAKTRQKPQIVDKDLDPIIDKADFYSGCYGRASVIFYAFDMNGNKGVACLLQNLQKLEDGEPFGGQSKAEDDFAEEYEDLL